MELTRLIGEIYEAALDENRWPAVMQTLNAQFNSIYAAIVFFDSLNRRRTLCWLSGNELEALRLQYLNEFLATDMTSARIHTRDIPDAGVITIQMEPSLPGFEDPAYYRFMKETVNVHHRMAAKLMMTNYAIAITSVNRREQDRPYSQAEIDLYATITPHLARAFRIHHQLSAARSQGEKLLQTLKNMAHGVLLLDANLRVVFANPEGIRITSHHPALRLDPQDHLLAGCERQNRNLQALLSHTLQGDSAVPGWKGPSIGLKCESRLQPLKLTALSLTHSGLDPALASEGICVAVFVTDVDRRISIPDAYLRHTYRLTPAECEVAAAIANGATVASIAARRRVEESTVRWQVKSLLGKTHTATQSELVHLLVALGNDFAGCAV